jgi:phosphatidylglycerophosphate synthase
MEASNVIQGAARVNVRGMKGWMKFLGVMNIIAGALNALSVVGILWAWLPIWLGIILVQSGSRAREYAERGDETSLAAFTGKLKTYFTISGVLLIISLALGLIAGIVWVVLITAGIVAIPHLSDYLNR